jgi:hypothetical protein
MAHYTISDGAVTVNHRVAEVQGGQVGHDLLHVFYPLALEDPAVVIQDTILHS